MTELIKLFDETIDVIVDKAVDTGQFFGLAVHDRVRTQKTMISPYMPSLNTYGVIADATGVTYWLGSINRLNRMLIGGAIEKKIGWMFQTIVRAKAVMPSIMRNSGDTIIEGMKPILATIQFGISLASNQIPMLGELGEIAHDINQMFDLLVSRTTNAVEYAFKEFSRIGIDLLETNTAVWAPIVSDALKGIFDILEAFGDFTRADELILAIFKVISKTIKEVVA